MRKLRQPAQIFSLGCWIGMDKFIYVNVHDDDDDVYFLELQHVGYKNLYPYRPAQTA
jgi:hypothetical protein